jgi:hypothetical protein
VLLEEQYTTTQRNKIFASTVLGLEHTREGAVLGHVSGLLRDICIHGNRLNIHYMQFELAMMLLK